MKKAMGLTAVLMSGVLLLSGCSGKTTDFVNESHKLEQRIMDDKLFSYDYKLTYNYDIKEVLDPRVDVDFIPLSYVIIKDGDQYYAEGKTLDGNNYIKESFLIKDGEYYIITSIKNDEYPEGKNTYVKTKKISEFTKVRKKIFDVIISPIESMLISHVYNIIPDAINDCSNDSKTTCDVDRTGIIHKATKFSYYSDKDDNALTMNYTIKNGYLLDLYRSYLTPIDGKKTKSYFEMHASYINQFLKFPDLKDYKEAE